MHLVDAKGLLSPSGTMNIYRGCQHGCIYCDARSRCYNMQHDFEDIEVKQNSPELLQSELSRKRAVSMIGTGSMSDPYMPIESELKLTQRCLEIVEKQGFGIRLLTKSPAVLRDLELFEQINRNAKAVIEMTLTTADDELSAVVEPGVAVTSRRFEALMEFRERGIERVVWLCPLLPYINDTEENLLGIIDYCRRAGVYGIINFGMGLTLREGNREYYYAKLDSHFPGLKERYIKKYGLAYEIGSDRSDELWRTFYAKCQSAGIETDAKTIFDHMRRLPERAPQISLFD